MSHLVAVGEALMLAKLGGLDLAKAFEAIQASSGNSFGIAPVSAASAAGDRKLTSRSDQLSGPGAGSNRFR
jgi:3-hydroxyisobutyrate dehydrogenase-like beta-hydroxyacid dehydrogenase